RRCREGALIRFDGLRVRREHQCRVRLVLALAGVISTLSMKVRCSSGCMAPTPTSLRAISSPRSLRMVSTIEYSHAPLPTGLRKLPSTRSGTDAGAAIALVDSGSARRRVSVPPPKAVPGSLPVLSNCQGLEHYSATWDDHADEQPT